MSSVLARYDVSGERRKPKPSGRTSSTPSPKICSPCLARRFMMANISRSEEHTSELQSLMRISYAVFCLKKKKKYRTHPHQILTNKLYTNKISDINTTYIAQH